MLEGTLIDKVVLLGLIALAFISGYYWGSLKGRLEGSRMNKVKIK